MEADDAGARGRWSNAPVKPLVEKKVQKVAAFTLIFLMAAGSPVMAVEECPVEASELDPIRGTKGR